MFGVFAWNVTNKHQTNQVYNKIIPWQNQNANQVLKHIHVGFNRSFMKDNYLLRYNNIILKNKQTKKQTSIEFKQPTE